MENKEQNLLNYFYALSQEVKKDKCMRLDKEKILIINRALSLLEETNIDIAKQEYENYLKEVKKINNEKSCFDCRFYDGICCMYKCCCKAILDEVEAASNCEHYDFGIYNQIELEKSNYK